MCIQEAKHLKRVNEVIGSYLSAFDAFPKFDILALSSFGLNLILS